MLLGAWLMLGGATPVGEVLVEVSGLRSARGELQLCLTANPRRFPSCVGDARAIARTVPAGQHSVRFDALPRGDWAVAVIHDANGNSRLDTFVGIPREGFGFSNNPPIGFGAPRFAAARFRLDGDAAVQQVKLRYLL
ncbi:MAG: DUF2141 domain-containing protein [Pseudomonadota bacterium]